MKNEYKIFNQKSPILSYTRLQYAKWNKISVLIFTRYKVVFHVILASELKGSFRRNINVAFAEHQKWLLPKWWGRLLPNYECGFRRNLKYELCLHWVSSVCRTALGSHRALPSTTRIESLPESRLCTWNCFSFRGYLSFERSMVWRLICLNAVL